MTILRKNRNIILMMLAAVLICTVLVLGLMIKSCSGQNTLETSARKNNEYSADIDPDARKWDGVSGTESIMKTRGISVPGYPSITVRSGTKNVTASLLNPEGNPCNFVFELVLADTGEVLYRSKQVPPGKAVTNLMFSKPLDKGEYNALLKISMFSPEGTAMDGANVKTKLIAE